MLGIESFTFLQFKKKSRPEIEPQNVGSDFSSVSFSNGKNFVIEPLARKTNQHLGLYITPKAERESEWDEPLVLKNNTRCLSLPIKHAHSHPHSPTHAHTNARTQFFWRKSTPSFTATLNLLSQHTLSQIPILHLIFWHWESCCYLLIRNGNEWSWSEHEPESQFQFSTKLLLSGHSSPIRTVLNHYGRQSDESKLI